MTFSYDRVMAIVAYRVALGGVVGTWVRRRGLGGIESVGVVVHLPILEGLVLALSYPIAWGKARR